LRGKRKRKKVPKNKKEKHATKNQPQCPNGHKTKWMLQAKACTLTLTIAVKPHVREITNPHPNPLPPERVFAVLAKATQLDLALAKPAIQSLRTKCVVVINSVRCFSSLLGTSFLLFTPEIKRRKEVL